MSEKPPTESQGRVLRFIRTFLAENQYPPTRQEIATHFGWYPNAAEEHLRALERRGHVRIKRGTARGIVLT